MSLTDFSLNADSRHGVSLNNVCKKTAEKEDSLYDYSLTNVLRRHPYLMRNL